MDFKRSALGFALALLALGVWLAWLWQPERQLRLHTAHLLGAIEGRNWSKVDHFLADNYSDRWGHDKAFVLSGLRQVFGNFIFVKIEHRPLAIDVPTGRVTARVKISGQGGPIAQYVVVKVNGLAEPFTFTWRKSGGWPWNWQLATLDHPTLDPDVDVQF